MMSNSRVSAMGASLYVNVKWRLAQAERDAKREASSTPERTLFHDDGGFAGHLGAAFCARGAQFSFAGAAFGLIFCMLVAPALAKGVIAPARMTIAEEAKQAAGDCKILHGGHCLHRVGELAVEEEDGEEHEDRKEDRPQPRGDPEDEAQGRE